ncbi:MAG: hypothetical protein IKQ92_07915 [Clostridia bacterium]|nr:hypothetical protein [Clostridia bacterium]
MRKRKTDRLARLAQDGAARWAEKQTKDMLSLDVSEIELSPLTEQSIRRALASRRKNTFGTGLRRAGVALAAFVSLFFALSMAVQPVRAAYWETLAGALNLRDTPERVLPEKIEAVRYPAVFPTDWRLVGADIGESAAHYSLTDESGTVFVLQSVVGKSGEAKDGGEFDGASVEEISLGSIPARLAVCPDGTLILTWTDDYRFQLTGIETDAQILRFIAQSLTVK